MSTLTQTPFQSDGVKGIEALARGEQSHAASLPIEATVDLPNLEGIVDLKDSTDTTVHVHHAPAVVHEHVTPTVKHITQEQITREIHTYDVIHRIQPVIDREILPTKHYVQHLDGTLEEIPASEVDDSMQELATFVERVNLSDIPTSDISSSQSSSPVRVKSGHSSCALEATSSVSRPSTQYSSERMRQEPPLDHTAQQFDSVHFPDKTQDVASESARRTRHSVHADTLNKRYGHHIDRKPVPVKKDSDFGRPSYEEPANNLPGLKPPAVRTVPDTPMTGPAKSGLRAKIRKVLRRAKTKLRGSASTSA